MPISRRRLSLITTATAAALAVVATAVPATAAPAAPPGALVVTYGVTGSTTVARSMLKVPFVPTTIVDTLASDGSLKATLPLAPVTVSYLAYGFLPTTATVVFTQVKPAVGALVSSGTSLTVTATAQYVVSLRDVSFGGTDAAVGPNCQTVRPVTVTVATPHKQNFDIDNGGILRGTYSISQFQNCGQASNLINDLVPGDGNTLTLSLTDGQIIAPTAAPAA